MAQVLLLYYQIIASGKTSNDEAVYPMVQKTIESSVQEQLSLILQTKELIEITKSPISQFDFQTYEKSMSAIFDQFVLGRFQTIIGLAHKSPGKEQNA